jgi:large subunit ribosomal protein L21
MYAVLENGLKQYIVAKNDIIELEKLDKEIGDEIEFNTVLMLKKDDGEIEVGYPYLKNVKIIAEVIEQDRAKKVIVFKKKRRKNYRRTIGHRQYYTKIKIKDIV